MGDSTSCVYTIDEMYAIPRGGWGMFIGKHLNDELEVKDLAFSGRSSKSFTTEENYKEFVAEVSSDDFVIVQFGHNDEKSSTEEDLKNRYTEPLGDKEEEGSFKYYLYNYYIKVAMDVGAEVIILSPVTRRMFDTHKEILDSHGSYSVAVNELASELKIPFIDLSNISRDYYNAIGIEKSRSLHAAYLDTQKGDGGVDNTHFSHYGAMCIARLIVKNLMDTKFPLSKYIKKYSFDDEYITRGEFIYNLERVMGDVEAIRLEDNRFVMPSEAYSLIEDKIKTVDCDFDINCLDIKNDGQMLTVEKAAEIIMNIYCFINDVKEVFTTED